MRYALKTLKPYIPGKSIEEAQKEFQIGDIVKLASNENPLGASPWAMDAVKKGLSGVSVYPDQHARRLREGLSNRLGVQAGQIIIGNGSDEIMLLIAQAFLSAGDEVILSENTFSTYEHVTRLMDGAPVFVPLKNRSYDLAGMAKKVSKKTKLVFLCNPNNPTGTIFGHAALDAFVKELPPDAIVVIDEAYSEYADDAAFPRSIDLVLAGKPVIVLRTFSKIYGLAGLRVGYGIAPEPLIRPLALVKLPFNANRLAQEAALAALEDDEFVKKSQQMTRDGRDKLAKAVKAMGLISLPSQANFLHIDLGKRSADKIFMELMRRGVLIRPLTSFGMPNAIRITIGTPDQMKKLTAALKEVIAS